MYSPVLKIIFKGKLDFSHDEGYFIKSSRKRRNFLYFIVDGEYPKWPLLMEPINNVTEFEKSRFPEVHTEAGKSVGTFLEMMR